jgi:23S rRNA pseudouridine1911/1915/1917 synthase
MSGARVFRVEVGEAGRLDKLVARRFPDASRAELARMFRRGAIRLDGAIARKGSFAAVGATIELAEPPPGPEALRPLPEARADLELLYEDDHVIAIAKPAGMPSHPLRAGELGTAANALVARYPALAQIGRDPREAGLIHRLDAGTSGALVAARTPEAWTALRRALSAGRAIKVYLALVRAPLADRGEIDEPLGQRKGRAIVAPGGLPSHTSWSVLARAGTYALVRCVARTGRMHQIRAHLAHAGAPIVGDTTYGGDEGQPLGLAHHFLHARSISLPHPATGAELALEAPLSPERRAVLEKLGFQLDEAAD